MLLKEQHPDLYARAIAIEDNARPRLEKVKGLGAQLRMERPIRKGVITYGYEQN